MYVAEVQSVGAVVALCDGDVASAVDLRGALHHLLDRRCGRRVALLRGTVVPAGRLYLRTRPVHQNH